MTASTAYRTCPLCEATCGLELAIDDGRITRVRGDRDHVLSKGFLCPKGAAVRQLVHDPDRLHHPLVRDRRTGEHSRVSWDDAFAVVSDRFADITARHGRDALALYVGNPNAHTVAGGLYLVPLYRALRTRNRFSASTVDQMPKHVACALMFGHVLTIPIPDVDRTDLMVILGADPWESNGSLFTAPDLPGRLEALQARGGRFVVVDPRRSRTAAAADDHLQIRPGTDAYLLFAIVHTLFAEGLVDAGAISPHVRGIDEVAALAAPFTPDAVGPVTGLEPACIVELARSLARAERAVVYGRIGTCTVEFGTLASWLVDVINTLTGNLDTPGGAMFPLAPHRRRGTGTGRGFAMGRWSSRVRGLPEIAGELPVAALAEEIDTPGDGRIRALLTVAGNPARSTPNSRRLERALASLELIVSVDPYLNETTRYADVILPPADLARTPHYDFNFLGMAVRNVAVYSPPVLPPLPDTLDECEILARLIAVAGGCPTRASEEIHDELLGGLLDQSVNDPMSPVFGADVTALREQISGDSPAERLIDVMLRTGAYGEGFGSDADGLSLDRLVAAPHGIDLGPLQPRLPEVLATPSGCVELCPPALAADVARLQAGLAGRRDSMVLIGRRQLRSNNSWLHNVPVLMKGKPRCTLQVHPADADRLGLKDGGEAEVTSRVGAVIAPVEIDDDLLPGVVSLPHGWGHDAEGMRLGVASAQPGVNSNILTDELAIDPLSGNAVLNGIPVTIAPN